MSYVFFLFGDNVLVLLYILVLMDFVFQVCLLFDLLYDGFFMLFLFKNGWELDSVSEFSMWIQEFLLDFECGVKKLNIVVEDVYGVKFVFCVVIDEMVLLLQFKICVDWECWLLQFVLFGEQFVGEKFFQYFEEGCVQGVVWLQLFEVFYMCLLFGFQGKYLFEGLEKFVYLIVWLGDEIVYMKGKCVLFVLYWLLLDQIVYWLKCEVLVWVIGIVFVLVVLFGYFGFNMYLKDKML